MSMPYPRKWRITLRGGELRGAAAATPAARVASWTRGRHGVRPLSSAFLLFWLLKLLSSFHLEQLWVSPQPRAPGPNAPELTTCNAPSSQRLPRSRRGSGLSAGGSAHTSPDKSVTSGEGRVGVTTSPKCNQLTGLAAGQAGQRRRWWSAHGRAGCSPARGRGDPPPWHHAPQKGPPLGESLSLIPAPAHRRGPGRAGPRASAGGRGVGEELLKYRFLGLAPE